MRLFSGPGCGRAVPDGTRYCYACKRGIPLDDGIKQHAVSDRERYAFLYSGSRWRVRVQPLAIQMCPVCARCNAALSELVDHKVPAGVAIIQAQESGRYPYDKWAGFYLLSNLAGLCRSCHGKKTDEDKAHTGPWPNVVETEAAAPKKRWAF